MKTISSFKKTLLMGLLSCLFAQTGLSQDIGKLGQEYIDAYFALNQEVFTKYLSDDVTWADPTWSEVDPNNKPVKGKEAVLEHLKQATMGISKMNFDIDQYFVSGNIVVFEGELSYTYTDSNAGKSYDFNIREVSVLEFSNGKVIKHTDYADFKSWVRQYQQQQ